MGHLVLDDFCGEAGEAGALLWAFERRPFRFNPLGAEDIPRIRGEAFPLVSGEVHGAHLGRRDSPLRRGHRRG